MEFLCSFLYEDADQGAEKGLAEASWEAAFTLFVIVMWMIPVILLSWVFSCYGGFGCNCGYYHNRRDTNFLLVGQQSRWRQSAGPRWEWFCSGVINICSVHAAVYCMCPDTIRMRQNSWFTIPKCAPANCRSPVCWCQLLLWGL